MSATGLLVVAECGRFGESPSGAEVASPFKQLIGVIGPGNMNVHITIFCRMSNLIQGSTARIKLTSNYAAKTYLSNGEYFTRECDVYNRLGEHPNVAKLLNIQGRTIFLERGQCLREILQKRDITDKQKSNLIVELARGLEYIHSNGVVHADISAANVIVCKSVMNKDHAKWIDFGGSAIDDHEALTSYDEYSYRPPEHPHPAVSTGTDIFAFGCTVFEIETGRPPYYKETRGMSSDEVLSYVEESYRERRYPPVQHLRFQSIIMGCWQGRYESMTHLREDITSNNLWQSSATQLSQPWSGLVAEWKVIRGCFAQVWGFAVSRFRNVFVFEAKQGRG